MPTIVISLQLTYAHEPKVQMSFDVKRSFIFDGKRIGFGPMGLCNPHCNFATTFVWLLYAWRTSNIKCSGKTWFPLATSTISNAMFQRCSFRLSGIGVINLWTDIGGVVIMWGGVPTCGLNKVLSLPWANPFNNP